MPVPDPELYPPFNIVRISHAEYSVTDLEASERFYADTIGLQVTQREQGCLWLRAMEERNHHCMKLVKGDKAEVRSISFKVFDEEDLEKAARWFEAEGLPAEWREDPLTGRTLRTRDPWGVPLEFYVKMSRLPTIHQGYRLYKGVKPLRIEHFNLFSADVDGAVSFYNRIGFKTTEYSEDAETGKVWAAWMDRKGGVHDIAFTNGVGPRLHHTAFWVPTPLSIIDLLDLMSTTGYLASIERGPGRHGISNAFFLYVTDPDGHRIEFYCSDYQTVDPDHEPIKWDLKDPQRQTLWGAPAPKSWFEKGSVFSGAPTKEPLLKAQPIIAP